VSRGLGRIERAILAALERRREPLLADRWHPLLVRLADDKLSALAGPIGGRLHISWAVRELTHGEFETLPAELQRDAVVDHTVEMWSLVHTEPDLGEPLTELVNMMRSADDPHAVEVSVQRAAKRLEQKSLIQRSYVRGDCLSQRTRSRRTRTFVCVRITPTAEELAEAADLRDEAEETYLRNTLAGVSWIIERGPSVCMKHTSRQTVDYCAAEDAWFRHEQPKRDDFKWLTWFENL
jgi:hypothetical protein